MVGTGRFELPTPRTPSECSTRLSHVPTGRNPQTRVNEPLSRGGVYFAILHQQGAGAAVYTSWSVLLSAAAVQAERRIWRVADARAIHARSLSSPEKRLRSG